MNNKKYVEINGCGFTNETRGQHDVLKTNIEEMLLNIFNRNLRYRGFYKLMGFIYDFKPHLKKYIVKTQHDLLECYAINKTFIRKNKSLYCEGKIIYIIEVRK